MLALKFWLAVDSVSVMCPEAFFNDSVTGSNEEGRNPLLDTLVKHWSGPLLLSYLEDTEAARLERTARLALGIMSLRGENDISQKLQPTVQRPLRLVRERGRCAKSLGFVHHPKLGSRSSVVPWQHEG